jgi:hypothetical protein
VFDSRATSAPAQKPRPAPVSTMAFTAGSSLAACMAWRSSPFITGVMAFMRSGRFMVTTATPSAAS